MVSALDVANTFLSQAKKEGIDITPMKLQKLVYIFYKEYLKKVKEKVFEEKFETWKYGPVSREIYNAFKEYRYNSIKDFYRISGKEYKTVKLVKGTNFYNIFYEIWNKYKTFDGIFLSKLTHQDNTAWSIAYHKGSLVLADIDIYNEESYEV